MKRKASALADSGIMPVSGNEEPGVLAWQSSNSSSVLPFKKRYYMLYPHAHIHPSRNVDDLVKTALAEKIAGQEAIGTAKVSVKKELVSKLELPAEERGVLAPQSSNSSCNLPFKKRYYMLYPHAPIHPERSFSNENESKTKDVVPVEDTSQIDLLRKTSSSLDSKPPINSASVIGSNGDNGKQVVGASEQEFYEDGEIREPLMQSYDDFVKRCDEKAEKLFHIDVNLQSPLLDKEETTRDDEQRPIGAIYNVTFSSHLRPVTGWSLSSRSGRERYSYMEEEKFHLPRNRDGPKFMPDRFQGHSFGSSRGDFMHGRGRGWGWGWGRGRYSGRDFESYDSRLYGGAFASNRRRNPLNDALHSFRHPPARRLSHHGREDAAVMGIQMNTSPRRCTVEDGSAYVGVRDSEKFNRGFPADIRNPVYSHQQSMYDGPDHHFVQGNTKFTAMQRSGFPRMRSTSPVRSRTWSLPPRRLMEGLNGHQDSSQHRSPVMYRKDRMRSSSQTSFTEEAIAPQKRDSPSYTARRLNDMRDVDAVQEHGHQRSLSNRGSPPDQAFTRTIKRVEILDHQERADGVGYFDGPIHTGRFPELHSGERSGERRKYGERQGGPRQMRNVKEQEGGNLRPKHEEEFVGSRLKKRRF